MSGNQLTHSSCFSEVNIRRYCCRSRLILSICPLVWGWYAVDNRGWIPNLLQMCFITCDANCGPLSNTIPVGSPWCFHTWHKYSFTVSRADMLLVQGMCYTCFTSPLYYLPYPGIKLPTSLRYWSLLITTLLILSIAPGLDSRTAMHLGASCISSLLYDPYLASCLPHVFLMTRLHPVGYDPLI